MTLPIDSAALRAAELRSERIRVRALVVIQAAALVLIVVRGSFSRSAGFRGEAWPFAVLVAAVMVCELVWLRFIERSIPEGRLFSTKTWAINVFVESLLPTVGLALQIGTPSLGPARAIASPLTLAYLIFISLSTLHLNRNLCWLAGFFSAAGYAIVAGVAIAELPPMSESALFVTFGIVVSCLGLILLAGFAAGVVAQQIREHVTEALQEAESRAKVERDLAVARSIQQSLLPTEPPKTDGFDIAGWNLPADETGGDYYDWQPLSDGRIAVTVADATGHGIGPALIMSSCRAYARAAFSSLETFSALLGHLSGLLYKDLPVGKFVTLVAGVLNLKTGGLELTSAGHGPLFFYSRAEDKFHLMDAHGPPLGLIPGMPYDAPCHMGFHPGDMLVLVTDGFLEWVNASDEEFGPDRLMDSVRKSRDLPSEQVISNIYSDLRTFAGTTPQADDLTALVTRRL